MALDPRQPVLVGVAQLNQHPDDPNDALEPSAMMAEVTAAAFADAGAPGMAKAAGLIIAVLGAWSYKDPARIVADAIGATDARTSLSGHGGNTPQSAVNELANRVAAGSLDVGLVVGAEAIWSRRRLRAGGEGRHATKQPDGTAPDERFGAEVPMSTELEGAAGMVMPVDCYPLFESAIRARRGETIDQHRDRISRLWARFNEVAVKNPYGWRRDPMTAGEIREPDGGNRMVGFPYTKAMNSNWDLDQAAALVVCSVEAAEAHGVPRDQWVFLHSGTDAHDTYAVSNRWAMGASPAIRHAGTRALALAGVGVDELAHIDVYSCFPSAVQTAAEELGLSEERQLTVTGGLTFAGGPLNNYVAHSIATIAGLLREDAGSVGLITANGGYLTKHAMGVYSTEPPKDGWRYEDVQDAVDAEPTREVLAGPAPSVTIESYTVLHGKEGPERALLTTLDPDGRRVWGRSADADLLVALEQDEHIGRSAAVAADHTLTLA